MGGGGGEGGEERGEKGVTRCRGHERNKTQQSMNIIESRETEEVME